MGLVLDEPSDNDDYYQENSLKFIMGKNISQKFSEVHIDYRDSFLGKGFLIKATSNGYLNNDSC